VQDRKKIDFVVWPAAARKKGLSLPGASLTLFDPIEFCIAE
jgi:hypothetical protein